jgi:nitrogen fixation protein NifQ
MIPTAPYTPQAEPAPSALSMLELGRDDGGCIETGAAIYRLLTGRDPGQANVDDDDDDDRSFDTHVFASILAVAATENGAVNECAGLRADDLALLMARWFPGAHHLVLEWRPHNAHTEDAEVAMVRNLLSQNCSTPGEDGRWLAAMVARRALESNHLWEDLGLRDRGELSRLMKRHFAPLAERNTRNMRWKRFFYRQLCEDDGFLMCATPVCTECHDFSLCFGDESGESRLAQRNRSLTSPAVQPDQEKRRPSRTLELRP